MNNQIPFGYNSNIQPMMPDANYFNNQLEFRLQNLEQRVTKLENKIKNFNTNSPTSMNNQDDYNPYQTSIHMM